MIRSVIKENFIRWRFHRSIVMSGHSLQDIELRGAATDFGSRKRNYCLDQISYHTKTTTQHIRSIFSDSSSVNKAQSEGKLDSSLESHLEFFGEPVSFLGGSSPQTISNAMAAYDGFLLAVVSKGKTCFGGGDDAGLEMKPAHAVAQSWAELLRHAGSWNATDGSSAAPMLAVAAVAHLLVQTGCAYVRHLDTLLLQATSGVPGLAPVQLWDIAHTAAARKDEDFHWNLRERMHLQAMSFLLEEEYTTALTTYLRLLRLCPGDVLALSLTMDLAQTLGDKASAFRASTSVSSYWGERRGGFIRPAIPGHSMASSLIALGLAVGGRYDAAELLAETAMKEGRKVCGGLATWAQVHVFDAKGRVAEGISALANFDGAVNYEGSGLLFFDSRLQGYGSRFKLDREERGRGKSAALRLYETSLGRVLGYSGFADGNPWQRPLQRAPIGWAEPLALVEGDSSEEKERSLLDAILGRKSGHVEENSDVYEVVAQQDNSPSRKLENWEPSYEDVLTWLPPTPALLVDATLLLLRFTLNGTIGTRNGRWDHMRNSWRAMLDIQNKHGSSLVFSPIACISASILFDPSETGGDLVGNGHLAVGLHEMGKLLQLGSVSEESEESSSSELQKVVAEREPDFWLPTHDDNRLKWREIVELLESGLDGTNGQGTLCPTNLADPSLRLNLWDFEVRPITEHAICYAACKAGDIESLSLARAICSQGVSLRPSSPEEWWRYSIVLGLLGDEVASEDALQTSINVGGGQGAGK